MSIKIQDGNKTKTYDEDENYHYIKTDVHINDNEINKYAEQNQIIKDNRRNAQDGLTFNGRIPVALLEMVSNGIFDKLTKNDIKAETYWLSKEGQVEIQNMALSAIFKSRQYSKLLGS